MAARIPIVVIIVTTAASLASCSGGGSSPSPPVVSFQAGERERFSTYAGWCGATYDYLQRYYLRSLFLDFYFWYDDINDIDPESAIFLDFFDYFDHLVSDELSPTGSDQKKDQFSFIAAQSSLQNQLLFGQEIGYGIRLRFPLPDFTGEPRIGLVVDDSVATAAGLQRGDTIVSIDGFRPASRSQFLSRLYPTRAGRAARLEVRAPNSSPRFVDVVSEIYTVPGVDLATTITLGDGRKAGYLLFNDHTSAAEAQLINAFTGFDLQAIDELVIDLRYNGGGFLYVANTISSMIAPRNKKAGAIFEKLVYRNPSNFIFPAEENDSFQLSSPSNPIPELELDRVYVLTGPGTCSASETIINSLRGIDVEVIQIGETTCGKPYGFVAFNNCGYSFLPVLFEGLNNKGEGGYSDGFKPVNAGGFGVDVPGCAVNDDFSRSLGDPAEALLAAALSHLETSTCPTPSLTISQDFNSTRDESRSHPQPIVQMASPAYIRAGHGLKILNADLPDLYEKHDEN